MQWLITYTNDQNRTQQTQIIIAKSYTEAYLLFSVKNNYSIVLEIKQI